MARRRERGLQDESEAVLDPERRHVSVGCPRVAGAETACGAALPCVSLKSDRNKKISFAVSIVTIVYKLEEMYLFTVVYNR